jgi:hypothetical protein
MPRSRVLGGVVAPLGHIPGRWRAPSVLRPVGRARADTRDIAVAVVRDSRFATGRGVGSRRDPDRLCKEKGYRSPNEIVTAGKQAATVS